MQKKWWRLRWDDAGRSLDRAVAFLDELTETSDVDVVWITMQGDLATVVRVEPHAEAMLYEGLGQRLPGARITPESASNITAYTSGLDHAYAVTGPVPDEPVFPRGLLDLAVAPASVRLTWRDGVVSCTLFTGDETDSEALRARWPGCRTWPKWAQGVIRLVDKPAVPPSRMMALPSSQGFTMLASRKMEERPFSRDRSSGGLLLGSDVEDRPVRLPAPGARLMWVGGPQRVDNAFGWMAQRWPGRVVVFDAGNVVDKAWQNVTDAVLVDWRTPGRSGHVNPLMRLPEETMDTYIERVAAWLESLGVDATILGGRVWKGLLALLRLVAEGRGAVVPPALLQMLQTGSVTGVIEAFKDELGALPEGDRTALESVDWAREPQCLSPVREILAQVFDAAEMVLWYPEYLSAERLREAPWVIFRVPRRRKSQRRYWRAMMPLLTALYGDDRETLVLAIDAGSTGGRALDWEGATSVVSWGSSAEDATGKATVPPERDVVAGARANPKRFAPLLGVSRAAMAAQNVYQAEARLRGDVGSIRLRLPRGRHQAGVQSAWRTDDAVIPAPAAILGEPDEAEHALASLLRSSLTPDERVLVIGKRDLWSALRATFEEEFSYLSTGDLPMMNPLSLDREVYAWIWWGRGLGLPAEVLQGAYREGIDTVQALLRYARSNAGTGQEENSVVAVLRDVCSSGLFGVGESEPAEWLDRAPRLAVESVNPALTRALVMGALEAGARIVLYDAPGIGRKDLPALRRSLALVYPDAGWIDNVLVTPGSNGLVRGLPLGVQEVADDLAVGEGYLYRRDLDRGQRITLEG
jgi:hypothetical protein